MFSSTQFQEKKRRTQVLSLPKRREPSLGKGSRRFWAPLIYFVGASSSRRNRPLTRRAPRVLPKAQQVAPTACPSAIPSPTRDGYA